MKTKGKPKAPGVIRSASNYYLGVEDVMAYLGCKENKAYTMIRVFRKELESSGKLSSEYPRGKIPKKYFLERCMIEE